MTEEQLEYRHVNPGMKNFIYIALGMMLLAGLVVAGVYVADRLFNVAGVEATPQPSQLQVTPDTRQEQ